MQPLADRIRPENIDEIVGQQHILGKGKLLYNSIKNKRIFNMIFYGPSGTGKTTVANVIAKTTNMKFFKVNATNASVADIKSIIGEVGGLQSQNGILLYLDEIQNFNKKQQQTLLEVIENGDITLIASTTENPYFCLFNAILSRSTIFEFKIISVDDIKIALQRGIKLLQNDFEEELCIAEDALNHIAQISNGDVRKGINALEFGFYNTVATDGKILIDLKIAEDATGKYAVNYDKLGDEHYNILSAFQKSIRGSDPQAALHYMSRLVAVGDLQSICRRLMVISCEDVGLAYPQAVSIVKSCVDCAFALGFPEARIPLAEAVILLATAPKSNSVIVAIDGAMGELENITCGEVPAHLKDSHYSGAKKLGNGTTYVYPHDYKNHYVKQQYLPDNIANAKYYVAQGNKFEQNIDEYWKKVKQ